MPVHSRNTVHSDNADLIPSVYRKVKFPNLILIPALMNSAPHQRKSLLLFLLLLTVLLMPLKKDSVQLFLQSWQKAGLQAGSSAVQYLFRSLYDSYCCSCSHSVFLLQQVFHIPTGSHRNVLKEHPQYIPIPYHFVLYLM